MKNSIYFIAIIGFFGVLFSACQSGQMMTSYENDDLYYSPGDVYITDYYNAQASTESETIEDSQQTDDYWDEGRSSTYSSDQMTINNYNAPFSYNPYGGFNGNNGFNNFNGCMPYGNPGFNSGWNMGFSTGWSSFGMPSTYFGFNYNYPFGNNYNYGYSMFNSWNNPYCNNMFGFNNGWNNPWNNPWNNNFYPFGGYGGFGNNFFVNNFYGDVNGVNMPVYGHRPQMSSGSVYNSTYTGGTLYNPANRLQIDSKIPGGEIDKPAPQATSPRDTKIPPANPKPEIKTDKQKNRGGVWDFFGTTPGNNGNSGNRDNSRNTNGGGGIDRTPTPPSNGGGRTPNGGGSSGGSRSNGGSGSSGGSGRTPRK